MKKLVFLTKSSIDALPEYKGYLNTNLNNNYNVYFIGENVENKILISKMDFGIAITLPKKKSRFQFYVQAYFILNKIKPSIVHVFWFPLAFIIPLLSKITFNNFITIGDFRTKSPFGGIKGKIKDIVLKMESIFFDKRITLDKQLARYIFNKDADCYIPMGYDKSIFYDRKLEKKYDFIYAGSISKDRGIFDFVKDLDKTTKHKYTFLIIGWGDEAEKIENLSKRFLNIKYLPKVNREEIPAYYSMSRIGISYVDKKVLNIQQPTKILEYIACGIDVIANDTIGTLELTDKIKFNGLVFNKMEELNNVDIKSLKAYTGNNISKFSWEYIIENKLIPFYESLLK